MFEIYRDTRYQGGYRVVYFSELDEREKEIEMPRVMAGEHFCDGFIDRDQRAAAKQAIDAILDGLNGGATITAAEAERALRPFMVA